MPVVHLMVKRPKLEPAFVFDQQAFKPCVRCRHRRVVLRMKQDVHRMRRDHEMDQDRLKNHGSTGCMDRLGWGPTLMLR